MVMPTRTASRRMGRASGPRPVAPESRRDPLTHPNDRAVPAISVGHSVRLPPYRRDNRDGDQIEDRMNAHAEYE